MPTGRREHIMFYVFTNGGINGAYENSREAVDKAKAWSKIDYVDYADVRNSRYTVLMEFRNGKLSNWHKRSK